MFFPSLYALLCVSTVFVFWFINEMHVEFKSQSKTESISKESKRNNQFLVIGTITTMIVMISLLVINVNVSSFGLIQSSVLSYIGSFIAFAGIIIRRIAINELKENFDGVIQIKKGQFLMKSGMYKYVRHPSYTGSILTFIGLGIGSLNIISVILLTAFIFTIYYYRIQIEEKVLIEGFKEAYIDYKRETPAFFPKLKIKRTGGKDYVRRN